MSRMKDYMMDIEDQVYGIEGLEDKVSESDHIDEVKTFVYDALGLITSFDKECADEVISTCWNEYWEMRVNKVWA